MVGHRIYMYTHELRLCSTVYTSECRAVYRNALQVDGLFHHRHVLRAAQSHHHLLHSNCLKCTSLRFDRGTSRGGGRERGKRITSSPLHRLKYLLPPRQTLNILLRH